MWLTSHRFLTAALVEANFENVVTSSFIYISSVICFRVRLAVNRSTQEAIAVKIVNSDRLAGNQDSLKKEVCCSQIYLLNMIIECSLRKMLCLS